MIHLQKFAASELEVDPDKISVPDIQFIGTPVALVGLAPRRSRDSSDVSHDIENTAGAESIHEWPLIVRLVMSVVNWVVPSFERQESAVPQAGPSRISLT